MKKSSFFKNTVFLTLTNIITGILGFIYSIILSRQIGPQGMGLYQLVSPLYVMFLFITGGGVTVAISKIAAEKKALGNYKELYRIVKVSCVAEFMWALLVTAAVVIGAGFLSTNFLHDKRTLYSILAFCPALIIVSISSVYKGAFFGLQRVVAPALIDMLEKFVRVAAMFLLVSRVSRWGVEYSSAAAVFALTIGEFASCALFYICNQRFTRVHPPYGKCDNDFQLVFNVLKLAIPLAINGILATVFSTVTAVLIPQRLQASGMVYEEALGLFGKLQGMALSIAFFPAIVLSAINILIIPSISEAVTFRRDAVVNHRINIAIRVASITAFSSTALILSMPNALGQLFFKDPSIGELLKLVAPGIPLVYISMVTNAILNGLGKQTRILINNIIVSAIDLVLIYVLVGMPSLNIKGYAIDFIGASIVGLILNYQAIKSSFSYSIDLYNTMILPLLCSTLMYILTKSFFVRVFSPALVIVASLALFGALYMLFYKSSSGKNNRMSRFTLRS